MAETDGKIFVVDDDAAVRDALSVIFDMEGYGVRVFADGDQFLAALKSEKPACVLLDVHMPGKSGLDILKSMDVGTFPAPVFIISGQGDIPMAVSAIKAGASDFIE